MSANFSENVNKKKDQNNCSTEKPKDNNSNNTSKSNRIILKAKRQSGNSIESVDCAYNFKDYKVKHDNKANNPPKRKKVNDNMECKRGKMTIEDYRVSKPSLSLTKNNNKSPKKNSIIEKNSAITNLKISAKNKVNLNLKKNEMGNLPKTLGCTQVEKPKKMPRIPKIKNRSALNSAVLKKDIVKSIIDHPERDKIRMAVSDGSKSFEKKSANKCNPADLIIDSQICNVVKANSKENSIQSPLSLHTDQESMEIDSFSDIPISDNYVFGVVIDTNILFEHRSLLDSLGGEIVNKKNIEIVVPYTTLQELDALKRKKPEAQRIIRWCNNHFENVNSHVKGQSFEDFEEACKRYGGKTGDDQIRDCCLLYKTRGYDMFLVTNDINLKNKSIMSGVPVANAIKFKQLLKLNSDSSKTCISKSDCQTNIIHKLDPFGKPRKSSSINFEENICISPCRSQDKKPEIIYTEHPNRPQGVNIDCMSSLYRFYDKKQGICTEQSNISHDANIDCISSPHRFHDEKRQIYAEKANTSQDINIENEFSTIKNNLHQILSHILVNAMFDSYGDLWKTIIFIKPPWTLEDVLKCIDKHWVAVFIDKFPNSIKSLLHEISEAFHFHSPVNLDTVKKKFIDLKDYLKTSRYKNLLTMNQTTVSYSKDKDNTLLNPILPLSPSNISDKKVQNNNAFATMNVQDIILSFGRHATKSCENLIKMVKNLQANGSFVVSCANLDNIRSAIISLGFSLLKLLKNYTVQDLEDINEAMKNYWTIVKNSDLYSSLPFQETKIYMMTDEGKLFIQNCVKEFEILINKIDEVK